MYKEKLNFLPEDIYNQYTKGCEYKESLGDNGIYEQSKINERFFVGDQWYGAECGNNRPLVRRNLIKRIGEYKLACISNSPVTVNYSADGVPNTTELKADKQDVIEKLKQGKEFTGKTNIAEIAAVMDAISQYFSVTSERVKFYAKTEEALRNAFISGTGIVYTYWDPTIETGLYADERLTTPIKGDIAFDVLNVENVCFGDPYETDLQKQPYIIINQYLELNKVKAMALANGIPNREIEKIVPDVKHAYSNNKVTVLTKIHKEKQENGETKVYAVMVTKNAVVKMPWCLNLKNYPLAKFNWERRQNSAYGESEITYLIPNQIALNRALTAEVWALMAAGMPITVVNGDAVNVPISNDPGQVITVYPGLDFDLSNAVKHVTPPAFESQYQSAIGSLANDTLTDSGATDAALGSLNLDNATALIQMREAAMLPMQSYVNRFYDFCEDIARIWADFWVNLYGNRRIKYVDSFGTHYMLFNAKRYKNLVINAKVDVGASTIRSEGVVLAALDNLLKENLITFDQYLERVPDGLIPNVTGLRREIKRNEGKAEE